MKSGNRFFKRLFSINPFRISLLITVLFLALFILKERGKLDTLRLIEAKADDVRFQLVYRLGETNSILGIPTPFLPRLFKRNPSDKVVIAAIDERTVARYGWPFPRAKWKDFLARMREYQAKAVVFDVVFDQPGEYLGLSFLRDTLARMKALNFEKFLNPPGTRKNGSETREDLPETGQGDTLQCPEKPDPETEELKKRLAEFINFVKQKEREADQDRLLAEEVAKNKDRIVLGWFGYRSKKEIEELADQDFSDEAALIKPSALLPVSGFRGFSVDYKYLAHRLRAVQFQGLQVNVPVLSRAARHFGFFTAYPETLDGTIRRTPMIAFFSLEPENPGPDNTFFYPSLSLAALSVFYETFPQLRVGPMGVHAIYLGDKKIPTDETGMVLVNWLGPWHTFPYYSVYDIITRFEHADPDARPSSPEELFKDKIVLVGSEAIAAHDLRTTPLGSMAGVEMHANVLSNILNNRVLMKPEWFKMFDLLFILAVGLGFGILLPRVSALRGGMVALAVFLGYAVANLYLFVFKHYAFTIFFPLSEILFIFIGVTLYRYATEEREKRFIKGAFEQYLSPKVIDRLMQNPSLLKLGGERKELTAFFSDLQGFSSFSEKMEPEELVHFLNIYLTEMCDIILKYDGTIDKFEGDAIIAFFGAPVDYPDHAARACLCAAECQERLARLRKEWAAQGWPEVKMRIGLNTGPMVVGNMGSKNRMDYTIMGNAVNLAARLESGAKQYKIYTMISEFTRNEAADAVEVRELDFIRVVGIQTPVRVYEILGKKGKVDPKKLEVADLFQQGLELYRQRYWMEARKKFAAALEIDPEDGPSKVFIARCEEFNENPPPAGWDGVYTMTTK